MFEPSPSVVTCSSANFRLTSVYGGTVGSVFRWGVSGHWLASQTIVGFALEI